MIFVNILVQTASLRNNSERAIWWKPNVNILKNFPFPAGKNREYCRV